MCLLIARGPTPLECEHSSSLEGDVGDAVGRLKREDGADLLLIGSTLLAKSLSERDLVDEYRFMVDPVTLGGGKRIFHDDGAWRPLTLAKHELTRRARCSSPTRAPR